MRDRVVQLPRDSRALLDNGLTRDEITLPLRELGSALSVGDHASNEIITISVTTANGVLR